MAINFATLFCLITSQRDGESKSENRDRRKPQSPDYTTQIYLHKYMYIYRAPFAFSINIKYA